jgi:carbonic anhydrase
MTETSRRAMLVGTLAAAGALAGCSAGEKEPATPVARSRPAGPAEPPVADGKDALARLLVGNRRHAAGKPGLLGEDAARRTAVAKGQRPFATVLGCVDSRVPPETVFDRGLGDLIVVRSAGEVLDTAVLGSVEFGVAELRTPLLVVLGHERCGAVQAALKGDEATGSMGYLAEQLRPAVADARRSSGDPVANTVLANVRRVVARLRRSPVIGPATADGSLLLTGAVYDLDSGLVTLVR